VTAAGLDVVGPDRQALVVAVQAAAAAVLVGPAGVRVRMPALGSVEHGTPAAALKGCPCRRCEQLRDRLLVTSVGSPAPVGRAEPDRDAGRVPAASRAGPDSVRAGAGGVLAGRGRSAVRARVVEADPVAVQRACDGDLPPGRLTLSERTAAVSRLTGSGLSARQVSARIGVSTRTVVRARRRSPQRAQPPAAEAVAQLPGPAGSEREAWRDEAVCRQVDPELFFPDTGGSARAAKRVCAGCPVRSQCLDWALAHDQRYGVWGGLTVGERMQLRRQRVERAG